MYGTVHRCRTLQMLNYMLLTVVVRRAQLRCRPSPSRNATCTNQARFVRHVASVDVRWCSVCEHCHRNQHALLQRHCSIHHRAVCGCVHLQMQIHRIIIIHGLMWIIFLMFSCWEFYSWKLLKDIRKINYINLDVVTRYL